MLSDRIEDKWIAAFEKVFRLSNIAGGDDVAILSESQSRALNVHLAELALARLGARPFHVTVLTPPHQVRVPVRSTGASVAIGGQRPVIVALKACPIVVDLTVEGLMHAPETREILQAGTRILNISNEHPEALERLLPDETLRHRTIRARDLCKAAHRMTVSSGAGTALDIDLDRAMHVPVWGYTDRPGTLAHWPGGLIVNFPRSNTVNGVLVLDAGDINLTFKRYIDSPIRLRLENDFIVDIEGRGTDADLMRRYLAAWNDKNAYAVSHVGIGLNPDARYEALSMYDRRDTNGTELRAFAGNFLFSTGANEFADRFTLGHFDIPVRNCTIAVDGIVLVDAGQITEALA